MCNVEDVLKVLHSNVLVALKIDHKSIVHTLKIESLLVRPRKQLGVARLVGHIVLNGLGANTVDALEGDFLLGSIDLERVGILDTGANLISIKFFVCGKNDDVLAICISSDQRVVIQKTDHGHIDALNNVVGLTSLELEAGVALDGGSAIDVIVLVSLEAAVVEVSQSALNELGAVVVGNGVPIILAVDLELAEGDVVIENEQALDIAILVNNEHALNDLGGLPLPVVGVDLIAGLEVGGVGQIIDLVEVAVDVGLGVLALIAILDGILVAEQLDGNKIGLIRRGSEIIGLVVAQEVVANSANAACVIGLELLDFAVRGHTVVGVELANAAGPGLLLALEEVHEVLILAHGHTGKDDSTNNLVVAAGLEVANIGAVSVAGDTGLVGVLVVLAGVHAVVNVDLLAGGLLEVGGVGGAIEVERNGIFNDSLSANSVEVHGGSTLGVVVIEVLAVALIERAERVDLVLHGVLDQSAEVDVVTGSGGLADVGVLAGLDLREVGEENLIVDGINTVLIDQNVTGLGAVGQEEVDIVLDGVVLLTQDAVAVDDHSVLGNISSSERVSNVAAAIEVDGGVSVEGVAVLGEQRNVILVILQAGLLIVLVSEGDVRSSAVLGGNGVLGLLAVDGSELLIVTDSVGHVDEGEDVTLDQILVTGDLVLVVLHALDLDLVALDDVVSFHVVNGGVNNDDGADGLAVDGVHRNLSTLNDGRINRLVTVVNNHVLLGQISNIVGVAGLLGGQGSDGSAGIAGGQQSVIIEHVGDHAALGGPDVTVTAGVEDVLVSDLDGIVLLGEVLTGDLHVLELGAVVVSGDITGNAVELEVLGTQGLVLGKNAVLLVSGQVDVLIAERSGVGDHGNIDGLEQQLSNHFTGSGSVEVHALDVVKDALTLSDLSNVERPVSAGELVLLIVTDSAEDHGKNFITGDLAGGDEGAVGIALDESSVGAVADVALGPAGACHVSELVVGLIVLDYPKRQTSLCGWYSRSVVRRLSRAIALCA